MTTAAVHRLKNMIIWCLCFRAYFTL